MANMLRVASLILLSIGVPIRAHADPVALTPGAGWTDFFFSSPGSSWNTRYVLTADERTRVTVTDFALSGDQFDVLFTGTAAGSFTTSPPTSLGDWTGNRDFAAVDPRWSTGSFVFDPGHYTISGIAIRSPFGSGVASIRADAAPTPEPGTLLLTAAALAAAAARRRQRRVPE